MGRIFNVRGLIRWLAVTCMLLVSLSSVILLNVQAQTTSPPPPGPPSGNAPIPFTQYGVVTVSATESFSTPSGLVTITLNCNGFGTFFLVKLLFFLNPSGQTDLNIDSINLNGWTYQFNQYYNAPRVTVVSSGSTVGELLNALTVSLPTQLTALIVVKDPLDNQAIPLSGGTGTGFILKLRPYQGGVTGFGYISAVAVVTAPSNDTISISMS